VTLRAPASPASSRAAGSRARSARLNVARGPRFPGVIPPARGDYAIGPGDPRHLPKPAHRISHEAHDQPGRARARSTLLVGKGEMLGDTEAYVDVREARPDRGDERGGRVRRRDGVGAQPVHQRRGQRSGPASRAQNPPARPHAGPLHHCTADGSEPTYQPGIGSPQKSELTRRMWAPRGDRRRSPDSDGDGTVERHPGAQTAGGGARRCCGARGDSITGRRRAPEGLAGSRPRTSNSALPARRPLGRCCLLRRRLPCSATDVVRAPS
jgi:hypothetical protein